MITDKSSASHEDSESGLRRTLKASGGDRRDVPPDVVPGSDADVDREGEDADVPESDAGSEAEEPSPGDGEMDDNIDDLGRRPDGTEQDQPGAKL